MTHHALLAVLLSIAAAAHAQTHASAPAWQRIELGEGASGYPFAIYSNRPWSGDMSRVKSAVLVFHGMGRNGAGYYAAAERLLGASGAGAGETLLIAPNFFAPADVGKHALEGMPLWRSSRWNAGRDADNWPQALSSFQPIDDLLRSLMDRRRFPLLERVALAGHSGGGQIVHRYAVLNAVDEQMRTAGIALRYIVANPSSYLYLTNERPREGAFVSPDASACARYNEYRYGMENMLRYAGNVDGAVLFERYAARDVTYLLGTDDNDPNHAALDNSCAAKAGGAHRLERGRNYIRYERYLAGATVKLNRRAYEVVGVGHQQSRMLGSKCAAYLMFGMSEAANPAAAPCRAPAL